LTSSTILEQLSFGRKGKKAMEYGGFRIARVRRNPAPSKHGRTA
jgi:hypothetical protein